MEGTQLGRLYVEEFSVPKPSPSGELELGRVSPWLVRFWLAMGAVGLALLIAFVTSSEASRKPRDVPGFTLLPLIAWGMFLHSLGELRGSRKLRVLGLVVMFSGLPIVVYIYLRWFRLLP